MRRDLVIWDEEMWSDWSGTGGPQPVAVPTMAEYAEALARAKTATDAKDALNDLYTCYQAPKRGDFRVNFGITPI